MPVPPHVPPHVPTGPRRPALDATQRYNLYQEGQRRARQRKELLEKEAEIKRMKELLDKRIKKEPE